MTVTHNFNQRIDGMGLTTKKLQQSFPFTFDNESEDGDANVNKAKTRTYETLKNFLELTAQASFTTLSPLDPSSLHSESLSFQQSFQTKSERLISLEEKVTNCSLDFAPFNLTSLLPTSAVEKEKSEQKKTTAARCIRDITSTLTDDYSSGVSYAALGFSTCLEESTKDLDQEQQKEIKEFIPKAVIGSAVNALAAPLAAIHKVLDLVTDIFVHGAAVQASVEFGPYSTREEYSSALQSITKLPPEIINEMPNFMINIGMAFEEFDSKLRSFDQHMVEEYRTIPDITHHATYGGIDTILTILPLPGVKKVKEFTIKVTKNSQLLWRTHKLIRADTGATFVPLSSALRRVYRMSGNTKKTFITDIKEIEKAIGKLSKGQTSKRITLKQAQELESRLGLIPGTARDGGTVSIIKDIAMRNPTFPTEGNQLFRGKRQGLPKGGPEVTIAPIRNTGGGEIQQVDIIVEKTTAQKKEMATKHLKELRNEKVQLFSPKNLESKLITPTEYKNPTLNLILEASDEIITKTLPRPLFSEIKILRAINSKINVAARRKLPSAQASITKYGSGEHSALVRISTEFQEILPKAFGSEILRSLDLKHLHIPPVHHLTYDGVNYSLFRGYAPGKDLRELLSNAPKFNSNDYLNNMSRSMIDLGKSQRELRIKSLEYPSTPNSLSVDWFIDELDYLYEDAKEVSRDLFAGLHMIKDTQLESMIKEFSTNPGMASFTVGDAGLCNFIYSFKQHKLSYIDGMDILNSIDSLKKPLEIAGKELGSIIGEIYSHTLSEGVDFHISRKLVTKFLEGYEYPVQKIVELYGELHSIDCIGDNRSILRQMIREEFTANELLNFFGQSTLERSELFQSLGKRITQQEMDSFVSIKGFKNTQRGKELVEMIEKLHKVTRNLRKLIDYVTEKHTGIKPLKV